MNGISEKPRYMSVLVNVGTIEEFPKAGRNLAKFIESVDQPHGPFTLTVSVGVGGVDIGKVAEAESAGPEITFVPDFGGEGEGI